jgi:hypothetical protein
MPNKPTTKTVTVSKTTLPVTKAVLLANMPICTVTVAFGDGSSVTMTADPRMFSTGSIGYYISEKLMSNVTVDGKTLGVKYQAGLNLTVVGSKDSE